MLNDRVTENNKATTNEDILIGDIIVLVVLPSIVILIYILAKALMFYNIL